MSDTGGANSDNHEDRSLLDLTPCSLLEVYRRCEGTYYRHTTRLHDVTYCKVVISSDFFSRALFCMYNDFYIYRVFQKDFNDLNLVYLTY